MCSVFFSFRHKAEDLAGSKLAKKDKEAVKKIPEKEMAEKVSEKYFSDGNLPPSE